MRRTTTAVGNPLWRMVGFLTIPHILVFLVGVHIYRKFSTEIHGLEIGEGKRLGNRGVERGKGLRGIILTL